MKTLSILVLALSLMIAGCEGEGGGVELSTSPSTSADAESASVPSEPVTYATPVPTVPVSAVMPTKPETVSITSLDQSGFSASWSVSTHSSGIREYEVLLMSGSTVVVSATSTTDSISVSHHLDPATYSVAVRGISNTGIPSDYTLNSTDLNLADLTFNVTLRWSIQVADGTTYKVERCTSTKQLSYAATQTAVNSTYSACNYSQNGYDVSLVCPADRYLVSTDYRYRVPVRVTKANPSWIQVTTGGSNPYNLNYEVGTCGIWTPYL